MPATPTARDVAARRDAGEGARPPTGGFRRLLAIFGGLLALICVPLGLSGPTAWVQLPAHLGLTGVAALGALLEGLAGHPERARRWGLLYLVATAAMIGTLELAAHHRGTGAWYWGPPWIGVLVWGWVPPLISGLAGVLGDLRRSALTRRALRRRRA